MMSHSVQSMLLQARHLIMLTLAASKQPRQYVDWQPGHISVLKSHIVQSLSLQNAHWLPMQASHAELSHAPHTSNVGGPCSATHVAQRAALQRTFVPHGRSSSSRST